MMPYGSKLETCDSRRRKHTGGYGSTLPLKIKQKLLKLSTKEAEKIMIPTLAGDGWIYSEQPEPVCDYRPLASRNGRMYILQ